MSDTPRISFRKKREEREASDTKRREEYAGRLLIAIMELGLNAKSYWQQNETHKQAEALGWTKQDEFARLQLKEAKKLGYYTLAAAIFAFASAIGVIWSVRDAEQTTDIAYRSWVAPQIPLILANAQGYFSDGDQIKFQLNFENYGARPANNVHMSLVGSYIDTPPDLDATNTPSSVNDICSAYPLNINIGSIFPSPNGRSEDTTTHTASDISSPNTPIVYDSLLRSGVKVLRVEGCISYKSLSDEGHTSFCYLFTYKSIQQAESYVSQINGAEIHLGEATESCGEKTEIVD